MGRSIDPSLYTDEEARLMGLAFNAAWDQLVVSGSIHAQPYRAERTRELLALKIIELLRRGAPNLQRLRDEALRELQFSPSPVPGQNVPQLTEPASGPPA
jgi:hypothetical protein